MSRLSQYGKKHLKQLYELDYNLQAGHPHFHEEGKTTTSQTWYLLLLNKTSLHQVIELEQEC